MNENIAFDDAKTKCLYTCFNLYPIAWSIYYLQWFCKAGKLSPVCETL
jgi:hypothetical protein